MADKMVIFKKPAYWNNRYYDRGEKVPASTVKGCPHVYDPDPKADWMEKPKRTTKKVEDGDST